ncbi:MULTISPECIES: hypothetical protein [unclassified Microcoleus]|uniref:hypothetical protein n=1 Tax=unclassified Microcoleus TaxID=2642155 RepID=UPI002FD3089E
MASSFADRITFESTSFTKFNTAERFVVSRLLGRSAQSTTLTSRQAPQTDPKSDCNCRRTCQMSALSGKSTAVPSPSVGARSEGNPRSSHQPFLLPRDYCTINL